MCILNLTDYNFTKGNSTYGFKHIKKNHFGLKNDKTHFVEGKKSFSNLQSLFDRAINDNQATSLVCPPIEPEENKLLVLTEYNEDIGYDIKNKLTRFALIVLDTQNKTVITMYPVKQDYFENSYVKQLH
ncbi:MAG: hypothetical protein JXA94_05320 [Parachlamydiales bacterium]|nr:hypothetical protein [Parachlamydiales bacterium]